MMKLNTIPICHKCPHAVDSSGSIRNGLCDLNGQKIGTNCEAGFCPDDRFTAEMLEAASKPPEPPPEAQPLQRSEWGMTARIVARLAADTDAGLGDVVERFAAKVGGEWFKDAAKSLGVNCGCTDRQKYLNQRYPLWKLPKEN